MNARDLDNFVWYRAGKPVFVVELTSACILNNIVRIFNTLAPDALKMGAPCKLPAHVRSRPVIAVHALLREILVRRDLDDGQLATLYVIWRRSREVWADCERLCAPPPETDVQSWSPR